MVKPLLQLHFLTLPRFSSASLKQKTMEGLSNATFMNSTELKITELLKEVQVHHSPNFTKLVDDTVTAVKESIEKIPNDFKVTADLAPKFVRDIGADKVEFKFKKPSFIKIGGSYSIQTLARPQVNIDLIVRLPKECFHEKDYLNYRYHAKRCLYLCLMKKYLEKSPSIGKVEWSTLQNEARKPLLIVYPAAKLPAVPDVFVRITPSATSLFSISKLNLKRNNIHDSNHGADLQATPKYNSSILEDMFLEDIEIIHRFFIGWKELRDALILLKVWARQRSSIHVHDCLNGFLISVILAYLASRQQLNTSMTATEIFRFTLNFIATSVSWSRGLYFPKEGESKITKEQRLQLKESFPVVICHPSGGFNLAFRMSKIGFTQLQEEAAMTLKCIEKCGDGGFEEVFMTKIDFAVKYDYCMRINLKGKKEVYSSVFCSDNECWRSFEEKIHSILAKGLNDRVKFIRVTWRNTQCQWSVDDGLSVLDKEPLFIGISVSNLEKAFRMVDIGPSAESKEEALQFRKFWGEKAELRRFKDGRIAESTVWESEQWTRHLILKNIAEHVLCRHLSLSKENIVITVDQLDFSLLHGAGDPISYSGSLLGAFDVLSKRLRLIEDLPLKVSSVQPLDSAFRLTSVFPPEPHLLANEKFESPRVNKFVPSCIPPLEVMIQLEGSGNWPMDEIAIEKTKSSFLIQIGESLQKMWGVACTATENDVDVLMSGYAFRLKILHERGLSLINKEIGSDQAKRVPSTDKKLFIHSQHASMINGLQSRYPIYGPVVRLAKRWVASHLLSACLVEEAVELLVAHLFLNPLPVDAPCSRITGFLRFLKLLSQYDWTFSPLVVDINNDLSQTDVKEVNDNFLQRKKGQGEIIGPVMFLATVYDKASEAWTGLSPSAPELKRLVAYARSSADLLTKLTFQEETGPYRWECLFRTPLNNYDAVILLNGDKLPYPQRLLFPSKVDQGKQVAIGHASKSFQPFLLPRDLKGRREELKNKLLVDFNPSRCFIRDLEKEFPTTFKVWHDFLGGDVMGLTWGESYSSKKKRKQEEVVEEGHDPCKVLKAVGEVGKGFVRSIYFLKPPRVTN
ncbi:PREDICTED: nucleolar protein 6 isoform X2 [Lupinus angustifolius]|uniref:nucleolar protein 6 isoform X1 n=1 Tax=Lupinus angustifolius TaxID=3871 RepID=UPI00092FAAE3|nr:PREDICTED: nucleolar protein 6 isoform X1 [Lupinus angustifolius]XP_019423402.1 PREDICTED: nucleolar protein 6 isoform X2 [Lupinus angustifolius]